MLAGSSPAPGALVAGISWSCHSPELTLGQLFGQQLVVQRPREEGRCGGACDEVGDGHWRLRVFAGRENGKARHISRYFGGTKRQARGALAKLVTEVEQQQIASAGADKVGDLLDRWLDYIIPNRAACTIDEYRRLINKTIKPALGNVRVDRLSPRQLDAFYRSLQQKGLSGSSIHQHRSILHASLGRAVKWGLIAANPADRATAPRPARSTATAPTEGEAQKLIVAAEADGDHALVSWDASLLPWAGGSVQLSVNRGIRKLEASNRARLYT
jgi:Phage integrase, N-terminal SAM-like domain